VGGGEVDPLPAGTSCGFDVGPLIIDERESSRRLSQYLRGAAKGLDVWLRVAELAGQDAAREAVSDRLQLGIEAAGAMTYPTVRRSPMPMAE